MHRETGKLTIKDVGRARGLGNSEVRSVKFTPCAWEAVFRGFGVGRHVFFSSEPFSCFLEETLQTSWIRIDQLSSRDSGCCLEEDTDRICLENKEGCEILMASSLGRSSWIKVGQSSSDAGCLDKMSLGQAEPGMPLSGSVEIKRGWYCEDWS